MASASFPPPALPATCAGAHARLMIAKPNRSRARAAPPRRRRATSTAPRTPRARSCTRRSRPRSLPVPVEHGEEEEARGCGDGADAQRPQPAAPVRHRADERRGRRLERDRNEPHRGDADGAEAEVVHPSGASTRARRTRCDGSAMSQTLASIRASQRRRRASRPAGPLGSRCVDVAAAPAASTRPRQATPPKVASRARHRGDAPDHGPEHRAEDRRAHRAADQLAAGVGRRVGDEPREPGSPRARTREALQEARACPAATRCRRSRRAPWSRSSRRAR